MSLLVRPEPFSTEFNRLFNSLWESPAASQRWVPEMDLVENDDHYLLKNEREIRGGQEAIALRGEEHAGEQQRQKRTEG